MKTKKFSLAINTTVTIEADSIEELMRLAKTQLDQDNRTIGTMPRSAGLALSVGKLYLNRLGKVIKLMEYDEESQLFTSDANGREYAIEYRGRYHETEETDFDLLSEVTYSPSMSFGSVGIALEVILREADPVEALAKVVECNLRSREFGFASDLVEAFGANRTTPF